MSTPSGENLFPAGEAFHSTLNTNNSAHSTLNTNTPFNPTSMPPVPSSAQEIFREITELVNLENQSSSQRLSLLLENLSRLHEEQTADLNDKNLRIAELEEQVSKLKVRILRKDSRWISKVEDQVSELKSQSLGCKGSIENKNSSRTLRNSSTPESEKSARIIDCSNRIMLFQAHSQT
jgi:hypothetical protein